MTTIKVDGVSIMGGNSKMGHVMHINLPPPMTCDHGLPCYTDGCYAIKFYRLRETVRRSWDGNWEALQRDRERYFGIISDAVKLARPKLFRWHSAGDVPDLDYWFRMHDLTVRNPQTRFMCFTKKYDIIAEADRTNLVTHRNMTTILSGWPGCRIPPDLLRRYPSAWMHDAKNPDPHMPADALPCSGGCESCGVCWILKAGQSVQFDRH